jgi:hypothetical protein
MPSATLQRHLTEQQLQAVAEGEQPAQIYKKKQFCFCSYMQSFSTQPPDEPQNLDRGTQMLRMTPRVPPHSRRPMWWFDEDERKRAGRQVKGWLNNLIGEIGACSNAACCSPVVCCVLQARLAWSCRLAMRCCRKWAVCMCQRFSHAIASSCLFLVTVYFSSQCRPLCVMVVSLLRRSVVGSHGCHDDPPLANCFKSIAPQLLQIGCHTPALLLF